jgi:hypothetical protein
MQERQPASCFASGCWNNEDACQLSLCCATSRVAFQHSYGTQMCKALHTHFLLHASAPGQCRSAHPRNTTTSAWAVIPAGNHRTGSVFADTAVKALNNVLGVHCVPSQLPDGVSLPYATTDVGGFAVAGHAWLHAGSPARGVHADPSQHHHPQARPDI